MNFYFDEMMPRDVADELNRRGHEVILAVDVGMTKKDDLTEHLEYSTSQGLVLVTCDKPFAGKASKIADHTGLICWTGSLINSSAMIKALHVFAEKNVLTDFAGRVFWIK